METYSAELAGVFETLFAADIRLQLATLPGRGDGRPPAAPALLWFGVRAAVRVLAGPRRDVVHGGDMALWPLAALARVRGAAVVLSAHGTDVGFARRRGIASVLYRGYLRLGAWLCRGGTVIANSRATAGHLAALGFAEAPVVALACRPVEPPVEAPVEPLAASEGRYLLFAGRLVRRKGLAWFVREVLPGLPEGLRLAVAGTVWEAEEAAALDHPRVVWLGAVAQPRLHGLMADALAVVVPNIATEPGHFEGFGLVAAEAATSGAVLLAARIDGFTDSVIDGKTGRLLPPGDAAAWAEAIREVAGWSAATRAAATTRARETARTCFSWERVARETLALYRAACRGKTS